MVSGKSRIIGLVVAYLDNYFYPDAVEKLSNAFQKRGYHVLVFMASNTADKIDSVMQEILDYQVDGIVLASVALSQKLQSVVKKTEFQLYYSIEVKTIQTSVQLHQTIIRAEPK